jgi:hypothetical protein
MESEVVRGGIQIPHTSPRNCRDTYAKLLLRVDPRAPCGFGFEGKILRPGSTVTDAELRPSEEYPEMPVLLEYAQVAAQGRRGHNRRESLYVLWRFDGATWIELGRSMSASWEWAIDLRPLAVRALDQRPHVMRDLAAAQKRIAAALAQELEGLESADQWRVLGIIHDQLACRVAAIPRIEASPSIR